MQDIFAVSAEEAFAGRAVVNEGYDNISVIASGAFADDDLIAVINSRVDHTVTADAEDKGIVFRVEFLRERVITFDILLSKDRGTRGDRTDDGDHFGHFFLSKRYGSALGIAEGDKIARFKFFKIILRGGSRRKTKLGADLSNRRRVAVFFDVAFDKRINFLFAEFVITQNSPHDTILA